MILMRGTAFRIEPWRVEMAGSVSLLLCLIRLLVHTCRQARGQIEGIGDHPVRELRVSYQRPAAKGGQECSLINPNHSSPAPNRTV